MHPSLTLLRMYVSGKGGRARRIWRKLGEERREGKGRDKG